MSSIGSMMEWLWPRLPGIGEVWVEWWRPMLLLLLLPVWPLKRWGLLMS